MCPYCVAAKKLLDKRGVAFEEINLSRDPDSRRELVELTGLATFPQIVIDGHNIGGFNELREADLTGRLLDLLAA
jgi:glutaredoxin 3